jgi:hypothetical protein
LLVGERGEIEARGTLGARGGGEIVHRPLGEAARPLAFDAVDPYLAQLRGLAARASRGFEEDPTALANLEVLDAAAACP